MNVDHCSIIYFQSTDHIVFIYKNNRQREAQSCPPFVLISVTYSTQGIRSGFATRDPAGARNLTKHLILGYVLQLCHLRNLALKSFSFRIGAF